MAGMNEASSFVLSFESAFFSSASMRIHGSRMSGYALSCSLRVARLSDFQSGSDVSRMQHLRTTASSRLEKQWIKNSKYAVFSRTVISRSDFRLYTRWKNGAIIFSRVWNASDNEASCKPS